MSKAIRWSLDLRWQRPSEPVGFYGLKEGLLMRSSKDPSMKIDWVSFDAVNRHDKQTAAMTGKVGTFSTFLTKRVFKPPLHFLFILNAT